MYLPNQEIDQVKTSWVGLVEAPFLIAHCEGVNFQILIGEVMKIVLRREKVGSIKVINGIFLVNFDKHSFVIDLSDGRIIFLVENIDSNSDFSTEESSGPVFMWDYDDHIYNQIASSPWRGATPKEVIRIVSALRGLWKLVIDLGVSSGNWILRARAGCPLDPHMRQIPNDAWPLLHVTDWTAGVAVSPAGNRIYSVVLECDDDDLVGRREPRIRSLQPSLSQIDLSSPRAVAAWVSPLFNPAPLDRLASTGTRVELDVPTRKGLANLPEVKAQYPSAPTIAAETRCRKWLVEQMRVSPNQPRPKKTMQAEAQRKFEGLSQGSFRQAWKDAIRETGAVAWSQPGRRN